MAVALDSGFVLKDRVVYTYAPDGRNRAVVTGYSVGAMFVVEHVVVFAGEPRTTLIRFARTALAKAWDQGYESVVFCLPTGRHRSSALGALGERLGFMHYSRHEDLSWWLCRRPA